MADQKARLKRQFEAIARRVPALRRIIGSLLNGRLRIIRIPLACALILGGVLAILPIFGVWMLPLGLLLLAVDIPRLQPFVSRALIRVRRRIDVWRHRGLSKRKRDQGPSD
ncbi:MAG: tryptophan synthase subunit beta [Rhodobacteraceae bacterium]|nr:tryptophan synthase subunit beta [Paracoccaceae bacterium]|tara:strand:- start:189 stop:521 length:333 start_codon:yes stop_codon:yes gene_type:complete